ncbi:MAG: GNAT family N-acetyltransferase [Spirochaetaceae bacterium]|nr:GNAT family N-acetyltransferase [Spirochaetaceae bacterium]
MGALTAPQPLSPGHDVSQFDCGAASLNTWLQRKARLNEAKGGARTYVVCDGDRVVAFYSLAASSVERRRVSSRVGRSMPEPIPVILLGQLAVDEAHQGMGLGSDLLVDAAKRSLAAAEVIGARAIVVQALDDRAAEFSHRWGFRPFSEHEPLMLILRISELSVALHG